VVQVRRDALSDVELAALTGGARLAVITALTTLREDHVALTDDGGLVAELPPPADAGEVERDLFETVRRTPGCAAAEVVRVAAVGDGAKRILAQLAADGLLVDEGVAARMHVLWLRAVGIAVYGAAGLAVLAVAGTGDRHTYAAIAATVLASACVARSAGRRRSGPTAAGRAILADAVPARWEEPRAVRGGLAFTVATLGSAALWSEDPDLATALHLPAETPASGVYTMTYAAATNCGGSGCGSGCGGGCGCG
jgi:uncharacterized protein (TIGR04222 family)